MRAPAPPRYRERVEIRERDRALFLGLFEARVMLREQIADLYFAGSYEAAAKRLQKLEQHGYIRERRVALRRGTYLPRWISIADAGFLVLKSSGLIEDRFTWETARRRLDVAGSKLAHDLNVVDLWVAFEKAGRGREGVALKRFLTWPYLYQFEMFGAPENGGTLLLPDAFAVIGYADDPALPPVESALFFEWDRSTQWRRILREKALAYDHFYRSGAFAERNGGKRSEAEEYPFRVIFAVKNEERRNNLLEELARPSRTIRFIPDQFWCTTWPEILGDPLGAIYLHVDDYRQATTGTMYDPARYVTKQRVLDRDELVRERAIKRSLFT
jgi:hypothetical protein